MSTTPIGLILDFPGHKETYVPWKSGTYALFGKNGIGKSRVLTAIRHLFQGGMPDASNMQDRCSLIVEAHMPELPPAAAEGDLDALARQILDFERRSEFRKSFLGKYLQVTESAEAELDMLAGEAAYAKHIDDEVRRNYGGSWEESAQLWQCVLKQRYFEIQRVYDTILIRPFYLESRDHPEVSAYLVETDKRSDQEEESSILWSPLTVGATATVDDGRLCTAVVGEGHFHRLHGFDVMAAMGHTCVDLRAAPEPKADLVGRALAQLLTEGADYDAWATQLGQEATRQLRLALQTSVGLRVDVPSHADLLAGKRLEWLATVPKFGNVMQTRDIPFERLSTAERTWALLAIHRATASMVDQGWQHSTLLIDEPEQGLHRAAEHQALGWLAEMAQGSGTSIWCATHSPTLLSDERVVPVAMREELRTGNPISRVTTMKLLGPAEREELESLGLSTTDLLATRRGFLLVEGAHDETVLSELIGTELAELNVEIIPIRGARHLPAAIEARTLFDFTDALLFALLDGLPSEGLDQAWSEARKYADDAETALRVLTEGVEWPPNDESGWMKQWLMRSIERGRGRHSRVEPLGVSRADIIEYLPVQTFAPDAISWEDLRTQHAKRRAISKNTPKDFKSWLSKAHHATFNTQTLRQASQRMDHVPHDFTHLLDRIGAALREYEADRPM
ncbi:AAA family ATPase [Janibacter cremeus]|uniref:Uncharacterized protein n=1 Tax=Janibacter cremeus TaxID=1285192 RepID=A0A852VRY7_9MICO|nr:AAA family ATPase [Janibacter cremeus]NYF99682.1 hypothetical protein [Janibacter cremeus]